MLIDGDITIGHPQKNDTKRRLICINVLSQIIILCLLFKIHFKEITSINNY